MRQARTRFSAKAILGTLAAATLFGAAALGQSGTPAQPAMRVRAATVTQAAPTSQPASAPTATANSPAPAEPTAAQSQPAVDLSPQEIARLKTTYSSLSEREKAEMVAVYQDMGIDLLAAL